MLYLEDGSVIYDSRAIGRVLALQYANVEPNLAPDFGKDPKAFAAFEQALMVEHNKFEPFASVLTYQTLHVP